MPDPIKDNMCLDLRLFVREGMDWVEKLTTQGKKQHVDEEETEEIHTVVEKVCEDKYFRQQLGGSPIGCEGVEGGSE